jgi:aldose 1-epimerase
MRAYVIPLRAIFLRDGDITVGVAPDCGGALSRFDVRTRGTVVDILRPITDQDSPARCSSSASCFPLVPYGGRLREGRFEFEGRLYQFPLNAAPERHSSHGDGWSREWALNHLDRRSAIMSLDADASAPFQYRCTQSVSIAGNRVRIVLSAQNVGTQRIPLGWGLHPYFANRSEANVKAVVPLRWRWDREMMPVALEANADAPGFLRGQRVGELPIAAEYADWDGCAAIDWPTRGIRVDLETTPPLRHAVVWIPVGEQFFCFEPISHATDAHNRQATPLPGDDILVLEPAATAEQRFDFVVSSYAANSGLP